MSALLTSPTEPGIHHNLPEDIYHGDLASLSSSGARRLLEISPRQFRHEQLHGTPDTDTFEFGRAVHSLALGFGARVVEVRARDWKTNKAKEERKRWRAEGAIPLLTTTFFKAHAMATAVREHPALAPLLGRGWAEISFYWRDPATATLLRARPDWLHPTTDGAVVIVDLKTADSADPIEFGWAVRRHNYHLQQHWYQQGLLTHGLTNTFLFAVVSKHPPHVVSVCVIDEPAALEEAAHDNRRAIDLYAHCRASGHWPDYGTDIHYIRVPRRAPLSFRY
ncbi:PD-(D/E)XK nuclease-like domain-containing protein [Nocardia carnea]|uniref:PD-(D/E)XK nuclease-like domain-containing protein n=1 Tax=Nocardia carnea TaxID=37328 RepID=UPI002458252E|nr:PD-(D/E)XK nuclease-like domain-containing protein [Nocardia carnea]